MGHAVTVLHRKSFAYILLHHQISMRHGKLVSMTSKLKRTSSIGRQKETTFFFKGQKEKERRNNFEDNNKCFCSVRRVLRLFWTWISNRFPYESQISTRSPGHFQDVTENQRKASAFPSGDPISMGTLTLKLG